MILRILTVGFLAIWMHIYTICFDFIVFFVLFLQENVNIVEYLKIKEL